jgi:NAD+ diphosphatase
MNTFFKFCPNCCSTNFSFPENRRFECSDCGFVYFHNIAAAVAVVLTYQNTILFTVRNLDPDKGKLDLPGGFIDPNETASEAVCREIKEELGIDLEASKLQFITTASNDYQYRDVPYRTLDLFYEYELTENQIHIVAKDEISELIWIERSALDCSKIGFKSIRKVISERYLE